MKVQVKTQELKETVMQVKAAVPGKACIPILNCVLVIS